MNERPDRENPGSCSFCGTKLLLKGPATRSRCTCRVCQTVGRYPDPNLGAPRHRLFAIEFLCPSCKPGHKGRFFKKPDADDLARFAEAERRYNSLTAQFVPNEEIPAGDETDRLHRWGYRLYQEMFNARQLLGLETSCRLIGAHDDGRVRHALSTNLSDLLRYQNMLCRYDTMALKSLDIFSVHGFPVGLIQCESNLLGIPAESAGNSIGSGGWSNIIDKFGKAKAYCDEPFEVRHEARRKAKLRMTGEWIGDSRKEGGPSDRRRVQIRCGDAGLAELPPASLDAVLTDPPYYGSVQYAELMDFCYVWLRRLVAATDEAFQAVSTRHISELTANSNMNRGMDSFTEGLSAIFQKMAAALQPRAPLAFTYHHNKLEAYAPVAIAILDSGLLCSVALPCPSEMESSIHINGTSSSILDTVFVCRSQPVPGTQAMADSPEQLAEFVSRDVAQLRSAGIEASDGDIRCLVHGHQTRNAVARLRDSWQRTKPVQQRLLAVTHALNSIGLAAVMAHVRRTEELSPATVQKVDDGYLPF